MQTTALITHSLSHNATAHRLPRASRLVYLARQAASLQQLCELLVTHTVRQLGEETTHSSFWCRRVGATATATADVDLRCPRPLETESRRRRLVEGAAAAVAADRWWWCPRLFLCFCRMQQGRNVLVGLGQVHHEGVVGQQAVDIEAHAREQAGQQLGGLFRALLPGHLAVRHRILAVHPHEGASALQHTSRTDVEGSSSSRDGVRLEGHRALRAWALALAARRRGGGGGVRWSSLL